MRKSRMAKLMSWLRHPVRSRLQRQVVNAASNAPSLTWETLIHQDSPEPIVRTMYGPTLLAAVQKRWSSDIHQDEERFFVTGTTASGAPEVRVVSGTGQTLEHVVATEVWA